MIATPLTIMTTTVISLSSNETVEEAVRLMLAHHVSALPVLDAEGEVIGLISEGDLMRRVRNTGDVRRSWWLEIFARASENVEEFVKLRSQHVADVMTRKVLSVDEETPVSEIAKLLETHRIKRVPVLRGGLLVGIVSRANLLHALSRADQRGLPEPSDDDRELRIRIDAALKEVPVAWSNLINYSVENGKVSVSGLVDSRAEENAIRVAIENVQGVQNVHLQLGLAPTWAYYGI